MYCIIEHGYHSLLLPVMHLWWAARAVAGGLRVIGAKHGLAVASHACLVATHCRHHVTIVNNRSACYMRGALWCANSTAEHNGAWG